MLYNFALNLALILHNFGGLGMGSCRVRVRVGRGLAIDRRLGVVGYVGYGG